MKTFLLFIMLGLSVSLFAQSKSDKVSPNGWKTFTFVTADTMVKSRTYILDVIADLGTPWSYDMVGNLHKVRGYPTLQIAVDYRWSNLLPWTPIDSITVGPMQCTDTLITFSDHDDLFANYLRWRITTNSTTQASRFTGVTFKCWHY